MNQYNILKEQPVNRGNLLLYGIPLTMYGVRSFHKKPVEPFNMLRPMFRPHYIILGMRIRVWKRINIIVKFSVLPNIIVILCIDW